MAVDLDKIANLASQAQAEAAKIVDAARALQEGSFGPFREPISLPQKSNIKAACKAAVVQFKALADQINAEIS